MTAYVFEQQCGAALFGDPVSYFGDLKLGVYFDANPFELIPLVERGNEFSQVVKSHLIAYLRGMQRVTREWGENKYRSYGAYRSYR